MSRAGQLHRLEKTSRALAIKPALVDGAIASFLQRKLTNLCQNRLPHLCTERLAFENGPRAHGKLHAKRHFSRSRTRKCFRVNKACLARRKRGRVGACHIATSGRTNRGHAGGVPATARESRTPGRGVASVWSFQKCLI